MKLPGGLFYKGELHTDVRLKPLTGMLERLISESGSELSCLAEQVSTILTLVVDEISAIELDEHSRDDVVSKKIPIDKKIIQSLNSGDRHYLMQQLEAMIDPSPKWLTSSCGDCNELIQFQYVPGSLPVKQAGKDYPETSIFLSVGEVTVRSPTGFDEEDIAHAGDNTFATDFSTAKAENRLFSRLISQQKIPLDSARLSTEDKQLVDHLLDEMNPQVAHEVNIDCPYCQRAQIVSIDNYVWISREIHGLDEEIHQIASRYHWSEEEILNLPRSRRKRYIQLIEKTMGKYQADDYIQQMNRGLIS
ncbi:hypothetical protein [sulfur-oxidizing endosymbiont of Gigantopelta aegis]|uniref:hypothetical protein n=1 Tax=sulfur-oxidizing endosymbiont of Gigantopelta aegis TaxID=2794934 RepID=UPI0018DDBA50|nr:hypothetical protein [sulfur-oxidizing endosymbiont of Gigantopelta aegis]